MGYDDWKLASDADSPYDDAPLDEPDGPTCIYCSGPIAILDDNEPYCSALCAAYADMDNNEDR